MKFKIKTSGHHDFIDITGDVKRIAEESGIKDGIVSIFVTGSTAAVTIMEYEKGIIKDFIDVLEKIAPEGADYEHHKKWNDHNGAAHIKSVLIGTDLVVPIESGRLQLGVWQQIVLIDFDEKPREREIIVRIISSI